MILDLNGKWELGICTDAQYRGLEEEIAGIDALKRSGILVIDGTVPGNYELDLERKGLIPDPFLGKNLLLEHEREMNHLFYGKRFEICPEEGRTYLLTFDGIDTVAEIYVKDGAKITKGPVRTLKLPFGMTLAAMVRGEHVMLVDGNTQIMAGDYVVVFSLMGTIQKLDKWFN